MIDYVAFETVPLVREVKAIRRAMSWLQKEMVDVNLKPWWISCVFPNGQFPEVAHQGGPRRLSARDVAIAALGEQRSGEEQTLDLVPTGIGINCTSVEFLPGLLAAIGQEVAALSPQEGASKPFLAIYPRGVDPDSKARVKKRWAEELGGVVRGLVADGIWEEIFVGGCCTIGPDDIRELALNLNAE